MSTEYLACVVVGLPAKECNFDFSDYDLTLDQVHTTKEFICGIIVDKSGSFSYNQLDLNALDLACSIAKDEFKKLTGLDAKVYLSLDSY